MSRQTGFLGWVERAGNRLPDPVFIFVYLILGLVLVSILASLSGLGIDHPVRQQADGSPIRIDAVSLLASANLEKLLVEMPKTFTGFHPLGYVLVVMLGAGVAERAGLLGAAMRAGVSSAPRFLLTPAVVLAAILGNLAADAAYVVLVPLAGVVFAAAGRHPIAGITVAFAGVSGGFSANLLPGQLDALLFGITEAAVFTLTDDWTMNIAGNWYFIIGMTVVFLPVIWAVNDLIVEPRLGDWTGGTVAGGDPSLSGALSDAERRGLRRAGVAALLVVFVWFMLSTDLLSFLTAGTFSLYGNDIPLYREGAEGPAAWTPFYQSLVAGFLVLFLASGAVYGAATGSIKNHADLVEMTTESMRDLAYYLVLAFAAAHFVAMFNWSNLGLIFAVFGARGLEASGLPIPVLLSLIVVFSGMANLFVGSASAKWALLAPVLVPMLMFLGVSPEMATATYRVGDSATNIITPLMVYFPLILTFAQRWQSDYGIGSLTAAMLPYSLALMLGGILIVLLWASFGIPLGPGAEVYFTDFQSS